MKKALGLLFISSSLFSMQLALQMPAQRFIKHNIAMVNTAAKEIVKPSPVELKTPKLKIDAASIRVPHYVGEVQLYYGKKGFVVVQDGEKQLIEKVFMDKTSREITKRTLKPFLKSGFLKLNQTNDGKFTLQAHHRLPGGGPILGAIMYWVTKSLCYTVAVAGVGTIAVGTGGAAVVVGSHIAAAGAGIAVASTIPASAAIVTTAGVGVATAGTAGTIVGTASTLGAAGVTGLAVAGKAVAGVGVAKAAALTTAAGVTAVAGTGAAATVGTGAACVMAIEGASTAVGTFFGMLPTP